LDAGGLVRHRAGNRITSLMSDEKPSQIGRYRILDEIGRGGFGRVYRGYDPTVRRPVAVKVLTDAREDVLTRFRNEAMVAGNLRHENIVTVYEYGVHRDLPFIVMEFLKGEDLQHIIASQKPLTLLEKCSIMWQVAEGLHCAHRNGVVHRDVKPANIMVLSDGAVKIMDFGIARLSERSDNTRLTEKGFLIGTVSYMAPEQFAGSDFDDLCDIFAYGVIFHELATGKHPFDAPDAMSMMYKLAAQDPPPIRESVPDFPVALQQIISKAIQKERDLRYHSLKELQFDLEPIRIELQRERASPLLLRAQELFQEKQLDEAKKLVQQVLSLDPSNSAARALREDLQKVLQRRTLQPRIEGLRTAAEEHLTQRRFADAIHSFEAALRLDPGNVFIQGRVESTRGLMEQSGKVAQLLVEARREFEQKNITSAHRIVFEVLSQDPQNTEAVALLKTVHDALERHHAGQRLDDALRTAQQLILIAAYDEAIAVLLALGPDSESEKVVELLERLRAEKAEHDRQQKSHQAIAAAKGLIRDKKLDEAAVALAGLRVEFPDNQEIANLFCYAENELAAFRRNQDIENMSATAKALKEAANFDGAMGVLDQALKKYPGENAIVRLLDNTMAAKVAWQRQQAPDLLRTRDRLEGKPAGEELEREVDRGKEPAVLAAPSTPKLGSRAKQITWVRWRDFIATHRKGILVATGATVVLTGAIAVVPRIIRSREAISVNVSANTGGVSMTIGKEHCVTPNCLLKLPGGTYTLVAAKDGYKTLTRPLTVVPGETAGQLAISLEALPQLLQVNTNFESGQVYLDGRHVGELRDGQYSAPAVAPGEHTIRVIGGGSDFQAEWNAIEGKTPGLARYSVGKDVLATVVTSAGASGNVACNCEAGDMKIDGAHAERSATGHAFSLTGLKEGLHQIHVGERSLLVDVPANPAINVILSLDRNVATLVVETGEDQVRVFLNNQIYPRTTEHGVVRIPVNVGEYTVRVEKENFQSPSPLTVALKKGDEKPVRFSLVRAVAYLEVEGATPGARVKIDGQFVGDTDGAGRMRHGVSPGQHNVELTKEDYSPIQITESFGSGKTTQLKGARVAMTKMLKTVPPAPPDPKQVEAQDWAQLASSTNAEDFDAFVRSHPGGSFLEQARARAGELRQQAMATKTRNADQSKWEKVDPSNKDQLQDYLSRFPSGLHAQEAGVLLSELSRKGADAVAAQRQAEQRQEEQSRRTADEQAVVRTLKTFETAYNQKDIASLQRLWDGVPLATYRQQFREATNLSFELQIQGRPSIQGNVAVAICTRSLSYKGQGGRPQTHTERVKVNLSRSGINWVIHSLDVY
jgi:serine/threonine protein kinase